MTRTREVIVPVQFTGKVRVEIPEGWPSGVAELIAISAVVATTKTPDAPALDTFEDVCNMLERVGIPETSEVAAAFDEALESAKVIYGIWTLHRYETRTL